MIDLINPNHSYMYGFLLADGNLHESSRNRGRIKIELGSIDKDILEKFQSEIKCYSSLKFRTRNTNFKRNYKSVYLSFYSLEFRKKLKSYGFVSGKKSELISIPNTLFIEKDFWRGFIDGDGTLGISKANIPFIGLFTKSTLIKEAFLNFLFKVLGVRKICNKNKRDKGYNILVLNEDAVTLCSYLYNTGLMLDRKKIKAEQIKNWKRTSIKRNFKTKRWTPDEDLFVLQNTLEDSIKMLNRTSKSIKTRRYRLLKG